MEITSVIGILIGFGALIFGYSMDGGNVVALWLVSAAVIVFGGTLGALILSYGFEQLKRFLKMAFSIFGKPKNNIQKTIDFIVKLSESARRDGLLSLEKVLDDAQRAGEVDPFLKRGVLMVVDGTDLDEIREILESDVSIYEERQKIDITMFESAAAYSPAMGMIGTIMGMIQVLGNMSSPEMLIKAIGVAFLTTLYGVVFANLFALPSANKLKVRLSYYRLEREMIIEGICAIRNSENPKMIRERLSSYLQLYSNMSKK